MSCAAQGAQGRGLWVRRAACGSRSQRPVYVALRMRCAVRNARGMQRAWHPHRGMCVPTLTLWLILSHLPNHDRPSFALPRIA